MNKKGFTLIEILIVVAIIAILASIVLVGLGPTQQSGRDARRISDLSSIQNVLELYYSQNGCYPSGATCGAALPAASAYPSGNTATSYYGSMATIITGDAGISVPTMPQDPSTNATYYYGVSPTLTGPTSYVLAAKLENPAGSSVFNNYTAPDGALKGDAPTTAGEPTADTDCTQATGYYCVSL